MAPGRGLIYVEIEVAGRVVRVPALKAAGRLWYHFGGGTHAVELATATERRAVASVDRAGPGVLLAPMPGKIRDVAVRPGESVAIGDVLMVLEAMKMEYTLTADRAGTVLELGPMAGAQVDAGQFLARVGDA